MLQICIYSLGLSILCTVDESCMTRRAEYNRTDDTHKKKNTQRDDDELKQKT